MMYTSERIDNRVKTLDERVDSSKKHLFRKTVSKGEFLYQQGEEVIGTYYIESGFFSLSAYHEKRAGRSACPLGFAYPQVFLGLTDKLDKNPTYRQSARAEALSIIYLFPRIDEINVLDLVKSLEMDKRRLYGLPVFETVEMKIGWYLSGLIEGSRGNSDPCVEFFKDGSATLHRSNTEIAEAIGMSRESVARTFSLASRKGVKTTYQNGSGVRRIENLNEFFKVFG